jgi:UDP-N-acetylglucosamine:LPS N-acetylglucosamine transferase
MKKKTNVKLGFIASSGGHFEQLMRLKPLMKRYNSFVMTEQTIYSSFEETIPIFYLKQINRREKTFFFNFLMNMIISIKVFFKEKPDIIISTGVLATIPLCLIGKIFGKKIIYLESFAKIKDATLTGKLMYRIADKFFVQWEEMLEIFPDAEYKGGIY